MHEFSVASGILETALSEAEKHKAKKIKKITIEVGQLSMISIEQLRFALDALKEDTIASKAEMDIRRMPARIRCDIGHESEISLKEPIFHSLQKLKCPKCGEKAEISGGRDCYIKELIAED